jgi:hypothetical protein
MPGSVKGHPNAKREVTSDKDETGSRKEVGEQSATLASLFGALQEAVGQASDGAARLEAPIAGYPNFEHLEAEGERLLPEQLKAALKALAQSNLLRGGAR